MVVALPVALPVAVADLVRPPVLRFVVMGSKGLLEVVGLSSVSSGSSLAEVGLAVGVGEVVSDSREC